MQLRPRLALALAVLVLWGASAVVLGVLGLITPWTAVSQVAAVVLALLLAPSIRGGLQTLREARAASGEMRAELRSLAKDLAALQGEMRSYLEESRRKHAHLGESVERIEKHVVVTGSPEPGRQTVRRLAPSRYEAEGTYASRRLNALAGLLAEKTRYLEIGLDRGRTFEAVAAEERWGVDPRPRLDVTSIPENVTVVLATSDRFFGSLAPDVRFDLMYLDGLHTYQQTYRDLIHSLRHLRHGGAIVIDDVVPSDEISAIPDYDISLAERRRVGLEGRVWHGDVFRLVKILADHHPELSYCTIVGDDNDDNEQTLVWRAEPSRTCVPVTDEVVASFSRLSYAEVFNDGIPEYFNPCSEPEALSRFIRAMTYR